MGFHISIHVRVKEYLTPHFTAHQQSSNSVSNLYTYEGTEHVTRISMPTQAMFSWSMSGEA